MRSARCSNPHCPNKGRKVPTFLGGKGGVTLCQECAYREEMARGERDQQEREGALERPSHIVYRAELDEPHADDPDVLRVVGVTGSETGERTYLVLRLEQGPDLLDDTVSGFAEVLPGDIPAEVLDRMFRDLVARHPGTEWADAVRQVLGDEEVRP